MAKNISIPRRKAMIEGKSIYIYECKKPGYLQKNLHLLTIALEYIKEV
jgi:hypothetical protein